MDALAAQLGISWAKRWDVCCEAADVSGLDYSMPAEELSDFYSSAGLYDIPYGPDYEMKCEILKYCCQYVVYQITHLLGPIWVIKTGGMPSGVLATSHGDSWVLLRWFCTYLIRQIFAAPESLREKLFNAAMELIRIAIYGDDHVWNRTMDPEITEWFNGDSFTHFLKTYYDVTLRDQKCTSFCSRSFRGYIVHEGMVFLKQFAVENPYRKEEDQPDFIAFRETPEFVMRAVHGKEDKVRTLFDFVLSVIGHAYNTNASNPDAWMTLFFMYRNAITLMGLSEGDIISHALRDLSHDDIADFRRKGVDIKDLLEGFPTFERLIDQNKKQPIHKQQLHFDMKNDMHLVG